MTGNRRRVIQWATGGVGVAAIRGVVEHPDLQLVGCWVHSPAKNGRDAGELAGIGPIGVAATSSVEEILDADADAVIYAPLLPDSQQVAAILRSGKNVITPVGWFYPRESEAAPLRAADFDFALPDELIAQHPAAERSASRLLDGTGAQPVDRIFRDLPGLLSPGDLLVFNDTQVIKARLFGEKATGGKLELLVERVLPGHEVVAHMKVSKKPPVGATLRMVGGFTATLLGRWTTAPGLFDPGVMSPDGSRFAYARITGDSGVIDLFMRRADGTIVRLTSSPGDDLAPSWSPALMRHPPSAASAGSTGR